MQNFTEQVTGMAFVFVPGGTFMMGDVFGDGHDNEKPAHKVTLGSFYMGKYPVTQGQWLKVMGKNPSKFRKGRDYPVECVSWDDTQTFVKKLTEMNKGKHKFRLPTEAEWEYAARSGGKKERYAGGNNVDAVAWYNKNSRGSTHPVGQKKPNGLGIYDMSGNVQEWCQDRYAMRAYSGHLSMSGAGRRNHTCRGGSWRDSPEGVRCTVRSGITFDWQFGFLGFRVLTDEK